MLTYNMIKRITYKNVMLEFVVKNFLYKALGVIPGLLCSRALRKYGPHGILYGRKKTDIRIHTNKREEGSLRAFFLYEGKDWFRRKKTPLILRRP